MKRHICRACEVGWIGDDVCWSCDQPGEQVAFVESLARPVYPRRNWIGAYAPPWLSEVADG